VNVKQLEAERQAVELIGQLQDIAVDIRHDTDHLATTAASKSYTKWSRAHHLEQIQKLVDEGIFPAVARLAEIRSLLPAQSRWTGIRSLSRRRFAR
jgi:predicted membrane metal-binding protein